MVQRNVSFDTRSQTGAQTIVRVFQRDTVSWREVKFIEHPIINIRRRLFVGNDVSASDTGKITLPIFAQADFEQGGDIFR